MLRGVTALLEAIDEKAEHLAQEPDAHDGAASPTAAAAADFTAQTSASASPLPPAPPSASASVTATVTASLRAELQALQLELERAQREARRDGAAAAAAREDLLRRSLQVQQLEDALRETRAQFDEHRAHSHALLEAKQREGDALTRRLATQKPADGNDGARSAAAAEEEDVWRARAEALERRVAQSESEQHTLRARLAAAVAAAAAAGDERAALHSVQEALRHDRLSAAEALDGEVAAHRRTRDLLQSRQRELNELRAAVERGGGTFAASGALVALRREDGGEGRDQQQMARKLLERQNAVEAAMREAAEWRRRYDRATQRLQEEQTRSTTRVAMGGSSLYTATAGGGGAWREAELRPMLRRVAYTNCVARGAVDAIAAVDAAVLRMTRLLMRFPLLRVMVLLYIAWVHGWLAMMLVCLPSQGGNMSKGVVKNGDGK